MAKPPNKKPAKGPGKTGGGQLVNERQRKFVEAWMDCGNASEAARRAGYGSPGVTGFRLLKNAKIQGLIKKAQEKLARPAIADRAERLEILSKIARGDDGAKHTDRISAASLISKMHGELIQRTQLTGADGGPIALDIAQVSTTDLLTILRGPK